MLTYLHDNYGDLNELDLEDVEQAINQPFDPTESFSTFVKRIEDCMDIAGIAGAACSDAQTINKAFTLMIKLDAFPVGVREWRRKATNEKTWANFEKHFAEESKEHKRTHNVTAKASGYQVANAANQALLEAQNDFKDHTSSFLNSFQKSLCDQCQPVQQPQEDSKPIQQAACTNQSDMHQIVKELRDQNKQLLDQNK